MTCPFCGAAERQLVCEKIYECGSSKLWQSKPCQELCRLREKKAKGLTWEYITCECYEANGFNGTWRIVYDSQSRGFDVLLDSEFVKETKTRIPAEAKAHAEELHQQAWRELRERWDFKGGGE